MQCQALLDSVALHTSIFDNIDVLYYSDEEYEIGYSLLKSRKSDVHFYREVGNFKEVLLPLFKYDYTCFAADDDIVYGDFDKELFVAFLERAVCFSLRLGENIDYCYSNDKPNKCKTKDVYDNKFVVWEWKKEELDFGYPLSVISHIFRTKEIEELSKLDEYQNPNVYEGVLQQHLNKIQPYMVSYKESKVFGVPANRVNVSAPNRNGLEYPYSVEELQGMYIDGKIIDVANMVYDIHAAQQEIKYVFA